MDLTAIPPLLCSAGLGLALALGFEPALSAWDRKAMRQVDDLLELGRCVGIDEGRVRGALRGWGIALAAVPVATYAFFRSPVLVPVGFVLVYLSPRWVLGSLVERRRRMLRDQLVPVCLTLANTSRAGLSLAQGLELIGPQAPDPIGPELVRMSRDFDGGRPLPQVLEDAAGRIDVRGFRMLCAALLSCIEHGGPITETLDGLALVVQENRRLERKMETQSAGGRMMLATLAAFPAVFFALNYVIDPELASSYPRTLLGQAMLAVVIMLIALSLRWGASLIRIESNH